MSEPSEKLSRTVVPLPAGHSWICKPGNSLFVAERGAAAFEIPSGWIVRHDGKETVSIHDRPPPADSCRISLTIFHLPPVEGGWDALPLGQMLQQVTEPAPRKKRKRASASHQPAAIHSEQRPDLVLAWMDKGCKPDPENGKPIRTRQLLARARLVQVLITFEMYEQCKANFEPAWNDLLRTLRVAVPRDLAGNVTN
jgi:hypothetical protein